ncbi:unnamed protein product [Calypogeia fissa]
MAGSLELLACWFPGSIMRRGEARRARRGLAGFRLPRQPAPCRNFVQGAAGQHHHHGGGVRAAGLTGTLTKVFTAQSCRIALDVDHYARNGRRSCAPTTSTMTE